MFIAMAARKSSLRRSEMYQDLEDRLHSSLETPVYVAHGTNCKPNDLA
jgi:hypothetical protein